MRLCFIEMWVEALCGGVFPNAKNHGIYIYINKITKYELLQPTYLKMR